MNDRGSNICKKAVNTFGSDVQEMMFIEDVPGNVAINEAVELTKKYSDEKSASFINGVLDKVLKSL